MPESRHDVAVIGAGIVGASVAFALARAGARTVVLDAGTPAGGTSGTSFGWLNAVRKEPGIYHRLNADGMAAYRELADELGGDIGCHGGGSLEWADDAGDEELRARVDRLARRDYAAEMIARERARTLEPGLAIPDDVREVAFYARDGWVDVPRLVRRLLDAVVGLGGAVSEATRVASLHVDGRRIDRILTEPGALGAESVAVCVGSATAAFLAPLGVTLPVGRVPGLLAVTSVPAAPLGRVVHAPGVHLRADASGGLLLGASDIDAHVDDATTGEIALGGNATDRARATPLAALADALLERARRVFPPARDARILGARIGVRPMPADGQSIVGRVPGLDNAWLVATHSGVTLGPLLGRAIAADILGKPAPTDLSPFRPDRFARR